MDDRIAAALSRVAIANLIRRRSHPVKDGFKLELAEPIPTRRGTLVEDDRRVLDWDVEEFLDQCRERRKDQPIHKRIPWEKRPKWNGSIINLTPVNRNE